MTSIAQPNPIRPSLALQMISKNNLNPSLKLNEKLVQSRTLSKAITNKMRKIIQIRMAMSPMRIIAAFYRATKVYENKFYYKSKTWVIDGNREVRLMFVLIYYTPSSS